MNQQRPFIRTSIFLALSTLLTVSGDAFSLTIFDIATSGATGATGQNSDGEDGGDASDSVHSIILIDSTNSVTARGGQGGQGGSAGAAIEVVGADGFNGGNGSNGGNAVVRAGVAQGVVLNGNVTVDITADANRGGDGGIASLGNAPTGLTGNGGSGGDGGNASVSVNAQATGDVFINADADAGPGGAAGPFGTMASLSGDGGEASLALYGRSTEGGRVTVFGNARGGSGGSPDDLRTSRPSTASAGDGVSVNLDNAVNGDTSGDLWLTQFATAGRAGDPINGSNGIAGSASSVLTKTTSSSLLILEARASGGRGSIKRLDERSTLGPTTVRSGDGAGATVFVSGSNDAGDVRIEGTAGAGAGGDGLEGSSGGAGADATQTASGFTSGDNQSVTVTGVANASGPGQPWRFAPTENASNTIFDNLSVAGNAISSSTGTAQGNSKVTVTDSARVGTTIRRAGWIYKPQDSTEINGSARSRAIAGNRGREDVSATSIAVGGSHRFNNGAYTDENGGTADAYAQGTGLGDVRSFSHANGGGGDNVRADATSISTGTSGLAEAETRSSSTLSDRTFVTAKATARVAGSRAEGVAASSRAESSVTIGIAQQAVDQTRANGAQAVAFANLFPQQVNADAAIAGNESVQLAFSGLDAIAVGLLGGAYSENGAGVSEIFKSEINFKIDMNGVDNTDVIIGLLDPVVTGEHGFDVLRFSVSIENTRVENIIFRDFIEAEKYFDDNLLNLGLFGDLISSDNILNIALSLDVTESHQDEGFSGNFALGAAGVTTVPVPAAAWLFISGFLGLLSVSRRCAK